MFWQERGFTATQTYNVANNQVTSNLSYDVAGKEAFGRSDFSIHGDSVAHPGHASWGCIVMPPDPRSVIIKSPDRTLEVVP